MYSGLSGGWGLNVQRIVGGVGVECTADCRGGGGLNVQRIVGGGSECTAHSPLSSLSMAPRHYVTFVNINKFSRLVGYRM